MGKLRSELLTLIKRLLKQAYRGPHTTPYAKEAEAFQTHANRLIAKYAVTGYERSDAELSQVVPFCKHVVNLGKGRYMVTERNNLYWLLKELKTCSIYWLPQGMMIRDDRREDERRQRRRRAGQIA